MSDLIERQAAIDAMAELQGRASTKAELKGISKAWKWIKELPSVQPERKKDIIQKFHDYQIDWLKSHYDIELEPQLEEMIVRFLHDTANCYMMEIDREEGVSE